MGLTVLDAGGAPIAGARARLIDPDGVEWRGFRTSPTDATGAILIRHLGEGAWTVVVEAEGYQSAETVLHAVEGVVGQAQVQLRPR